MSTPRTIPLSEIPRKIYYSISEVSEYTGVEPYVLRYWETKFTKLTPTRVGGNQRKYTRQDLELLYTIVRLLYEEGFTLEGAERKLRKGWPPSKRAGSSIGSTLSTGDPNVRKELVTIREQLEQVLNLMDSRA